MGKLEGKTALVTACTRGIGKAIVEKLSGEGAAVYMAVRRPDAAREIADRLNADGRQVKVVSYDGYSLETVGPMVEEVIRQAGRIDILVNNQGGNGKGVKADLDVVNTPAETFEKQLYQIASQWLAYVILLCYTISNVVLSKNFLSIQRIVSRNIAIT